MSNRKPLYSYSRAQTWKECPEKEYLKYVKHIRTREEGASLFFGTCIDNALGFLLNCKKDGKEDIGLQSFKDVFTSDVKKGWNSAFDDSKFRYRAADYDANVLSSVDDTDILKKWEDELGVKRADALKAEKQKDHKPFNGKKLKMFNRICWLSLKRKGGLMLIAFERQIFPNITKVIAVQHKIQGEVGDTADLGGYIDLICLYKGFEKPVVFDIKTSASFYESHSVQFSHQLHLYLAVTASELETNLAGYIVLLKSMDQKSLCSKCGFVKDGRHKTCPQVNNEIRCNGAWKGIPEGRTQVIINEVSKEKQEEALKFITNVTLLASQGLKYKNYDSCFNYGMCDMFHLCHFGDKSKYIIPPDKTEELKTLPVLNNEEKK